MPPQDGGDCQALGRRRPRWACPEAMRAALPEFLRLYDKRPLWVNKEGMRIEHSFGVWYTLRNIRPRPTTIIESGVLNGQSTWLLMSSLPGTRMFGIDPTKTIVKHVGLMYFSGTTFKDFSQIDWSEHDVDLSRTVLLADDHQSGYRRVIQEGRRMGIKHFLLDDNYHYLTGDSYSMKWACEKTREKQWPGFIRDNFGKLKNETTWEEHLEHGRELREYVKSYYEIAPFASVKESDVKDNDKYRSTPLLNRSQLQALNRTTKTDVYEEIKWYRNCLYVELY